MPPITKGTLKLRHILDQLDLDYKNSICADFGCNVGGFTFELLERGVEKIYAIDTGYGALDWTLRQNPKIVTKERCNVLFLDNLPKLDYIVIDMAWTRQEKSLPIALKSLKASGTVVSLLKPQYEAPAKKGGKAKIFSKEEAYSIACHVFQNISSEKYNKHLYSSPIQGGSKQKGSFEFWIVLTPKHIF